MNTMIVISLLYGLIATPTPEVKSPENFTTEGAQVTIEEKVTVIDEYIQSLEKEKEVNEEISKNIMFTAYYTNDGTGSGACTGSGLCTNQFQVNDKGWYTYQGKVVIATATNLCLRLTTGVCGQYNSLPQGYDAYDYGSVIEFTLDGKRYEGVVLDTCGASFWNEQHQRYDIFVAGSQYSIGKRLGQLHK